MSEPIRQNESDDEQKIPNSQNTSSSEYIDTDTDSGPSTGADGSRRHPRREPPPLDLLQRTLARCMSQIIVNMTNAEYQRTCLELLDITNLDDVQNRILYIVQEMDEKQAQQRRNRRQQ